MTTEARWTAEQLSELVRNYNENREAWRSIKKELDRIMKDIEERRNTPKKTFCRLARHQLKNMPKDDPDRALIETLSRVWCDDRAVIDLCKLAKAIKKQLAGKNQPQEELLESIVRSLCHENACRLRNEFPGIGPKGCTYKGRQSRKR